MVIHSVQAPDCILRAEFYCLGNRYSIQEKQEYYTAYKRLLNERHGMIDLKIALYKCVCVCVCVCVFCLSWCLSVNPFET